jgi:hypothetical protein
MYCKLSKTGEEAIIAYFKAVFACKVLENNELHLVNSMMISNKISH